MGRETLSLSATSSTVVMFDSIGDRGGRGGAGGADGGTLQLLERDRWRYLLFVDIAWSAMSGQAPEDMLVVSRY